MHHIGSLRIAKRAHLFSEAPESQIALLARCSRGAPVEHQSRTPTSSLLATLPAWRHTEGAPRRIKYHSPPMTSTENRNGAPQVHQKEKEPPPKAQGFSTEGDGQLITSELLWCTGGAPLKHQDDASIEPTQSRSDPLDTFERA